MTIIGIDPGVNTGIAIYRAGQLDELRTIAPHDATHRQNTCRAWPLRRHVCVSPPSWTKNPASISALDRTPRNCAWLPSSVQSFGAGVAVAQSL